MFELYVVNTSDMANPSLNPQRHANQFRTFAVFEEGFMGEDIDNIGGWAQDMGDGEVGFLSYVNDDFSVVHSYAANGRP